jgi:toxin CcdB
MARFDVYANPDTHQRAWVPYLLDVQNSFLDHIETRSVVPLHASGRFNERIRNLNPMFTVGGKAVVMNSAAVAAIPAGELHRPIANLADERADILNALDTLFGGY